MKTIITTVGTSIFTNLTKDGKNDEIKKRFEKLKQKRFSEWEEFEKRLINDRSGKQGLKSLVEKAIKNNHKASAEIESILKIADKEEVNIHLLATDTILSVLSAQIIGKWFEGKQNVTFNVTYGQDVIKDLQIENLTDFKKGLRNLVERFYKIYSTNPNPKEYILNITGGYKGLIPYMTLLGQITKIDLNYKFEETGNLIEIPRLPIKRDDDIFDEYFEVFQEIEDEVEIDGSKNYTFIQKAESCLETFNNGTTYTLNALGLLFWEDYKKEFFNVYSTDKVWSEFEKQEKTVHFFKQTFVEEEQRKKYNVCEQSHKMVCKKFSDVIRIYWFENHNKVFVYKTFDDHDKHERYINSVNFTEDLKQEIIQDSKPRKIKINHV
jgi:putative CRISPR-associated protein (TIGR02619 family)